MLWQCHCSHLLSICHYIIPGEFGIVYKGYLVGQFIDEAVAIKTLKGGIESNLCELNKRFCIHLICRFH